MDAQKLIQFGVGGRIAFKAKKRKSDAIISWTGRIHSGIGIPERSCFDDGLRNWGCGSVSGGFCSLRYRASLSFVSRGGQHLGESPWTMLEMLSSFFLFVLQFELQRRGSSRPRSWDDRRQRGMNIGLASFRRPRQGLQVVVVISGGARLPWQRTFLRGSVSRASRCRETVLWMTDGMEWVSVGT